MYKKPFFCTNLSLLLSKTALFHPPPPISTTLNLLFAKNTAILLLFALILCCKAGASHRFKSLPAIPGEVAAFRITGYLMNAGHFRKNTVSTGDLNRGRRTESRVLFGYFLHNAKSDNPFPCRELRGSTNLESAHPNNNFPLTKLNPFETFRFAESLSLPEQHTPCAFFRLTAVFPIGNFRGFANLESARHSGGFAHNHIYK